MNNFTFHSPTEFVFGKDTETKAGELLKKYGAKKVLVHYGSQRIVESGFLGKITDSIKAAGIDFVLLGGVRPNPEDTLVYEGIELCRKEGVDFILAVGGGSPIDSAKAIAAGVPYSGDFWDFFSKKASIKEALPVATLLTIPAAGSEGSTSTVINKAEPGKPINKRGAGSQLLRPVFSILNPELCYTLPKNQRAAGVADMMSHVMERYFTKTQGVDITDRLCEAILQNLIKYAPVVMKEPNDYEAWANLMWSGVIAHNDTCGVGRTGDWATHSIEHELSALYDVTHGDGLATMFPAWMLHVYKEDIDRFVQFAQRVWGIEHKGDKEATALAGIDALRNFWASIELPVNFEQLGAKAEDIPTLVENLAINTQDTSWGEFKKLTKSDVKKIFENAL